LPDHLSDSLTPGEVADLIIFLRGNLRMLSPDGAIITFFGPSSGSSIRGRQQGAVSALGIVTVIAHDANSRVASETRTDPASGDQAALVYTFASTGPHTGRILAVEKRLTRAGAALPIHRWDFTYHSGADSAGNLNDLKTAGESVWCEFDNARGKHRETLLPPCSHPPFFFHFP